MSLSNQYLHTLTSNASRLGARISETISEQARELSGTNSNTPAPTLDGIDDRAKIAGIKKQLELGSSEREKLDALKRLVALTSKSHPPTFTLPFFPSVVKLVASPSLEIRKLVYIYLLHHAPYDPDLALLSINTFQKDLSSDPNPLIRAMALRVLSGMRVPMVANVVVMGIKKCASDSSPYVRKVAALAIPKLYELDPSQLPTLLPILTQTLLSNSSFSPLCIGATVFSFNSICLRPISQWPAPRGYVSPEEQAAHTAQTIDYLKLVHPHYRRLCRILVDVDEWGQVEVMRLLLRYTRVMLSKPTPTADGSDLDSDLKLLLTSVEPTFMSRNPSVVLAATKVFYYLAPRSDWKKVITPLLRLLAVSKEVERVVIRYLVVLTSRQRTISTLLAPHFASFLLRFASDPVPLQKDKIRLLLNLLNADNDEMVEAIWMGILREFIACVENVGEDEVIQEAVSGVGELARRVGFGVTTKGSGAAGPVREDVVKVCVTALMEMIGSPYDIVVSSAVQILQQLVQLQLSSSASGLYLQQQQAPLTIIARLAKQFEDIKHAEARACVVWLVGQYAAAVPGSKATAIEGMTDWAPDLLRKCARSFVNEAPLVKMQIVTLAGKLIIIAPPPPSPSASPPPEESQQSTDPVADEKARKLAMLVKYVVHGLARYDAHWDVRDRARLVWGLVRGLVDKYSATSEEEENEVGGVVLRREQRGREVKGAFGALSAFGIGAASASEPSKRHQNYDELEDEDDRVKADETLVLDSFDEDVPEWMEKGVESKLRDSENDNAAIRKPVITAMGSGNFNRGEQASGGVSGAGARAASSAGPVVLVPTNLAGTSEAVASEPKKTWRDLDSFYADTEVVEEVEGSDEDEDSEEDEDDGSDNDGEEVSPERGEARRTADGSEESEEEDSSGAESHDERRALVGQP
ncbi:ARM repeat-containing protein [Coprinellus micaceus]|uniref:ARM repeat-containing protein n=1 Tax=Coprinellus micaceus TaxID=71717 RepID=A0A4Y7STG8_COPMI|nr:ARM repeat-containing protein [Coprinellus micaceus]